MIQNCHYVLGLASVVGIGLIIYNCIKESRRNLKTAEWLFTFSLVLSIALDLSSPDEIQNSFLLCVGVTTTMAAFILLMTVLGKKATTLHDGIVTEADFYGFRLYVGGSSQRFYWKEFDDAKFKNNFTEIHFKVTGKSLVLNNTSSNFGDVLKNLPAGFKSLDYQYITSYLNEFKTCEVCGYISIKDDECLSCETEVWSDEIAEEYDSHEDYLKTNQLEIFSTLSENESFNGFKLEDTKYEQDKNWKPTISEKEILDFSRKEYWN